MMTTLDSGFLFARSLKEDERYAGIPVIIATSVSSALGLDFRPRTDEDRANMYVDAYFDKPLDRQQSAGYHREAAGHAGAGASGVPPAAEPPGAASES